MSRLIHQILSWGRKSIEQEKKWLILLFPLACFFASFSKIRNFLYDKGFLSITRFPQSFVVSVGNLTSGGTGKTPFVIALLERLSPLPVAVLTRGYGGAGADHTLVVTSESDSKLVGDEPLLIFKRVPHAKVFVDKDRLRSAHLASKEGYKIFILDDGMQHRRLFRDMEITLVDQQTKVLPWGLLREPLSSLKRASYLVSLEEGVNASIRMRRVVDVSDWRGEKVALFTGVGKPDQVVASLEQQGVIVVKSWFLSDHETPSTDKLRNFAAVCENLGVSFLVCTEKDHVKLASNLSVSLPIYPIRMRLEVVEGVEYFEEILTRIKKQ